MKYKLFLDLDDTLADFTKTARVALQTDDFASLPEEEFWRRLIAYPDFFNSLDWLPDGRTLFKFAEPFNPSILTGIPRGDWAQPQKTEWCRRELGPHIPLIMCFVHKKAKYAAEAVRQGLTPILVDDRLLTKKPWEQAGGIFIHHISAESSIRKLRQFLTTTKKSRGKDDDSSF